MPQKTWELQERTRRFAAAVARLSEQVTDDVRTHKVMLTLIAESMAMESGYRVTCASSSPEKFIAGISIVARNAKKTKAAVVLLAELNLIPFELLRDLILEARGLEAIFMASRNTAKRRNPSERAAQATEGKTPRKRQKPPGVT
jgi:hypothetical protein